MALDAAVPARGAAATGRQGAARPRVSVIGTGAMGGRMAGVLLASGFDLTVYDVSPAAYAGLVAQGVTAAESAVAAAGASETVLLSLPTEVALVELFTGDGGLLAAGAADRVFVDTTTATPAAARLLAPLVGDAGGAYVDAPVKGGTSGAERGTLNVTVGGGHEAVACAMPVLAAIGGQVLHIGPSGHGHAAKLFNQVAQGIESCGVVEAFALAAALGVGPDRLLAALEGTPVGGGRVARYGQAILEGRWTEPRYVAMLGKDVRYFVRMASAVATPTPLAAACAEAYKLAVARGRSAAGGEYEPLSLWEEVHGGRLTEPRRSRAALAIADVVALAGDLVAALYWCELAEAHAAMRAEGVDLRLVHASCYGAAPDGAATSGAAAGLRERLSAQLVLGAGDAEQQAARDGLARALSYSDQIGAYTPMATACQSSLALNLYRGTDRSADGAPGDGVRLHQA